VCVRVLLVEDDRKLGPLLVRALSSAGYAVELCTSVKDVKSLSSSAIDLAVVDWMLPDGDGLEVCRHLRRSDFEGPIVMLTARSEVKDRVQALDLGADDYVIKPFAMDELLARLRALSRRASKLASIDVADLHIDIVRRYAFCGGKLVELTEREFDLLLYLARRPGHGVTKAELVENVWDAAEVVPNVVEVHVSRLRDKLGAYAWMIETLRGIGYRLRESKS